VTGPFALRSRHDREIAVLAVPALGSLVADPLLSLVDTAFVGRISTDALAGLGVATALFAIAFFVFNFLEYGTTTQVGLAHGADDPERAARATGAALRLAVVAGVVSLGLVELAADPVLRLLGASDGARAEALTYVRIRAVAAPAVLTVRAAHGAFRGYQDTRTPFVVTAVINGINIVLDPILIFVAGWGIAGAATATVAAQWAGAAWLIVLLRRMARPVGNPAPERSDVTALLRIGRDLVIRTSSLLAAFTVGTAVAARISDQAVAAHQVVSQLFIFLALALDALAVAAQAMVSMRIGRRNLREGTEAADRLAVIGVVVGVVLGGALAAASFVLPELFTDDPAVVDAMGPAYWIMAASQPLVAVVFVWDGVFFGVGDFAYLAGAMAASSVLAIVVTLLVLPLGWGLAGVWWGVVVLMVARFVTLAWRRWAATGPFRRM
jgi:putative MATE family efflux protein